MIVLDASAVLAYLRAEPGTAKVERALADGSVCSAANWSEIAQKVGPDRWVRVGTLLGAVGLGVRDVTRHQAELAAALWTRGSGLSLADRLCLALGAELQAPVLTADRAWAGLDRVELIR